MQENKIILNGKEYKIKDVNFDGMCELEELGLSLTTVKNKPLTAFRALVSYYCDMPIEEATKEIEAHLRSGGDFTKIYSDLVERLSESGFFQLISAKQKTTESK